jgi:CRP-like cAMP-binding protein
MMTTHLKSFLSTYAKLADSELEAIASQFSLKKVRKRAFLLKEGEICKDLIFVEKGCLRLFFIKDDIETSVWFAFPHSSAIEIYSFISEAPSTYFLQAIEDSEIYFLSKTELSKLYQSQPKMQELMRNFWEDVILNLLKRFTALQTDSAEKRYLDLMQRPDYLSRIPQKYLASFIGVTPTSLSRIRRQVATKRK